MTTKNQDSSIRTYQKQFKELLTAVFEKKAYFKDFFVNETIEALDGVQHNKTAFSVKTSDIPVAVTTYSNDANVAFGTGTAKSSRFGERTEVIYSDTDVDYTWEWAFHEGLDRHTVNNDLSAALADRLELQAIAKTEKFNANHGKFISDSATETLELADYKPESVLKLFNELSKYFINVGATGEKAVKVNADLYNAIVDHPLMTTGKNSGTNIDENSVIKFKGFVVEEVPDALFQKGEGCYAYIKHIAKAFTGINTTRAIESEDFDGLALQGAGKAGEFIPDDNKKAVVKVTVTPAI